MLMIFMFMIFMLTYSYLSFIAFIISSNYSAGKRDRGKIHPQEEGAKPPDSIEHNVVVTKDLK